MLDALTAVLLGASSTLLNVLSVLVLFRVCGGRTHIFLYRAGGHGACFLHLVFVSPPAALAPDKCSQKTPRTAVYHWCAGKHPEGAFPPLGKGYIQVYSCSRQLPLLLLLWLRLFDERCTALDGTLKENQCQAKNYLLRGAAVHISSIFSLFFFAWCVQQIPFSIYFFCC